LVVFLGLKYIDVEQDVFLSGKKGMRHETAYFLSNIARQRVQPVEKIVIFQNQGF